MCMNVVVVHECINVYLYMCMCLCVFMYVLPMYVYLHTPRSTAVNYRHSSIATVGHMPKTFQKIVGIPPVSKFLGVSFSNHSLNDPKSVSLFCLESRLYLSLPMI